MIRIDNINMKPQYFHVFIVESGTIPEEIWKIYTQNIIGSSHNPDIILIV